MVLCAAYNCNVRSGDKVAMYFFPKDRERCKIWVSKLKAGKYWPSKHAKLCSRHFTNDQFTMDLEMAKAAGFTKVALKEDAVPTIFDYSTPGKNAEHQSPRQRSSRAVMKRSALGRLSSKNTEKGINEADPHLPCPVETVSDAADVDASFSSPLSLTSDAEMETDLASLSSSYDATKNTDHYDNFTQTAYGLVRRRHVCIQTEILVHKPERKRTRDVQTQTEESSLDQEELGEMSECDDVASDPEWIPSPNKFSPEGNGERLNPAKERKFIVFESALDQFFKQCRVCGGELLCEKTVKGTHLNISSRCNCCGECFSWDSQPKTSQMPLGNLIIAAAILFSGSSPIKCLTMFRHASVEMMSIKTYNNIQSLYLVPSITSVWQCQQLGIFESLKESGLPLTVGGDARCCSPGHTAKYGSYSLMDLTSSKIVDMQLVQSNEVKNSYWMEIEGLKRCLCVLAENNIVLSDMVTDRHCQVKAFMRKERPDIQHWFDCWHVAKGIYKKLELLGKTKKCKKLLDWARSISNHLYWCAASSNGDGELVLEKWMSILNHVTNVHEGHGSKFKKCLHAPLDDRVWIKKDSAAFKELEKVVNAPMLRNDVKKLSPAEQTSGLEAFHKVVCHFAPKLVHYFHPQMEARLYLAAMHFNENAARRQAETISGKLWFSISYPKSRKGVGVAKPVKVAATYGYVQELMEEVLLTREHLNSYSRARRNLQFDKARPLPLSQTNINNTARKSKQDIIDTQRSRFKR